MRLLTLFALCATHIQADKYYASSYSYFQRNLTSTHCKEYGNLARITGLIYKTCPTIYDSMCNDPIFDPNHEFDFRCQFPIVSNSVISINSTNFLDLIERKDRHGRAWCMIVFFYSFGCPKSKRLAWSFNRLAGKFENVVPVGVDVTELSEKLYFRYKIETIPTVSLWVNGISVVEESGEELDSTVFKTVIMNHTDVGEKSNQEKRPETIPDAFFHAGGERKKLNLVTEFEAILERFDVMLMFFGAFVKLLHYFVTGRYRRDYDDFSIYAREKWDAIVARVNAFRVFLRNELAPRDHDRNE